jgi:hypothetical protein
MYNTSSTYKTSRLITAGCVATILLGLTGSTLGHHSPAVFDQSREITLVGVVKEFRWTNPHSWIAISVSDAEGSEVAWDVEMTGPSHLVRAGWRSSTVSAGDEVTIVANPLRTNETVGKFVSIMLPDGTELSERAP